MGIGAAALTGVRVVMLVVALGVVGLGIWEKVIIHDIEVRGSAVLELASLPQLPQDTWRAFFEAVLSSPIRVWIAIAASSFVSLAAILILLSTSLNRLKLPTFLLLAFEFLTALASGTSFGAVLSVTLKLSSFRLISPPPSSPLTAFTPLVPLLRAQTITTGALLLIALIAFVSASIQAYHRARDSKACSFEPTASALGMGHGYHAVRPQKLREAIPTLYDPKKPLPGAARAGLVTASPQSDDASREDGGDEEKGFADKGADMGRRPSNASVAGAEDGKISGPLGLQRPEVVRQMRPARPWSEMPKKR